MEELCGISDSEKTFISQSELFLDLVRNRFDRIPEQHFNRNVEPLSPIIISDYTAIDEDTKKKIASEFFGVRGACHFVVLNPNDECLMHPLNKIAEQLVDHIPTKYPVKHPMEGHVEAVSRFGPDDDTLKIYDLKKPPESGYREQAETADLFEAHNDGLGYGGAVRVFGAYADSVPLWGGYTYFQNLLYLSIRLAETDAAAFKSLFLPDAIAMIRPRGKGAIKVETPVYFINGDGRPQVFFRMPTGEYTTQWRRGLEPLERASEFLSCWTRPFAQDSTFVNFSKVGMGCFANNEWVVHGRTPFIDTSSVSARRRVLARKWFVNSAENMIYKHVPGMSIHKDYADLFPQQFGCSTLEGHWNYDAIQGKNIRKS